MFRIYAVYSDGITNVGGNGPVVRIHMWDPEIGVDFQLDRTWGGLAESRDGTSEWIDVYALHPNWGHSVLETYVENKVADWAWKFDYIEIQAADIYP